MNKIRKILKTLGAIIGIVDTSKEVLKEVRDEITESPQRDEYLFKKFLEVIEEVGDRLDDGTVNQSFVLSNKTIKWLRAIFYLVLAIGGFASVAGLLGGS